VAGLGSNPPRQPHNLCDRQTDGQADRQTERQNLDG